MATCPNQLLSALESGDLETALQLLPKDGPPVTVGPEGFTPLHCACRHGEAEVARLLITQYKYSIQSPSKHGQTPVHVAAQYGHINTLTVLVECSKAGELLKADNTSPTSSLSLVTLPDNHGNTALHTAALHGQLPAIKFLFKEFQCNTTCTNHDGQTLLHLAAQNGCLDVVKYLVDEEGCPTSPTDNLGRTPLYLAAGNGQLDVVRYLIEEKKCDPSTGATRRWKTNKFDLAPGRTPLHAASRKGHLEVVQYLVNSLKCDPSCSDEDRVTPLFLAAMNGHLQVVQFLVEAGCYPMVRNVDGRTPIHSASQNSHLDTVKCLTSIERVEPSCQDKTGITPLHLAAHCGCLPVVQFLVESGCDPMVRNVNGRTPIHYASQKGHFNTVKYLTSNDRVDPSCQDKNGVSPLLQAAECGHLPVVQFLVEAGCDPMVRNVDGRTPIHYASQNGHLDTVKYLTSNVLVDPSCQDKKGVSPLLLAAANGHLPVVQFLVEIGCDPMVRKEDGRTPIHYASQNGHLDTVKYLTSNDRVDPSCQDKKKVSPLLLAAESGHVPVVQFLVEAGCDPMVRKEDGRTPIHRASQNGHLDTVKYLVSNDRVDPSCQDKNGVSPLVLAAECGHLPVVQFLVEAGCDPMVRVLDGGTPLHHASQSGHLDTVKYLASNDRVDPSCKDRFGATPLVLAAQFGHLATVRYLVEEKGCDPSRGWLSLLTPIKIASVEGHMDVVLYLHSKGIPLPVNANKLNVSRPLCPLVQIYIVGNQGSGKSTLVKALTRKDLFGYFRTVGDVVPETAGIISSEFVSKKYGEVTFYDFAGHREYFASHEVIFENTSSPVILVVVDLSQDDDTIDTTLRFWRSFLLSSISAAGCQAHVIIVGSHGDKLRSRDLAIKKALLEQFSPSSIITTVGHAVLDCRYSASRGMTSLRGLLTKTCKMIRRQADFDYENGRILNLFIARQKMTACTFSKLLACLLRDDHSESQPLKYPDLLYQVCESLNRSGHILLLKNKEVPAESWIVSDRGTILSEVNGLLKHLKQCTPLGLVPLSLLTTVLKEHAPNLPPDLAIVFMKSMLFCSEVDPQALTLIADCQPISADDAEQYLLFPSLITVDKPTQEWGRSSTQTWSYSCGWRFECTDPDHFFTPRFLQTLQLELACRFALQLHPSSPGLPEPQRGCRLWLNGIRWLSDGIEVVMHVSDNSQSLSLMLRSIKSCEMECVRLRSTLIEIVFSTKDKVLKDIQTAEHLLHPHFFTDIPVPDCANVALSQVASALIQKEASIRLDNPALEDVPGYPFLLLEDLLYFEPYQSMGEELLQMLFSYQNLAKVIHPQTLYMLAQAFYARWQSIAITLHMSPADIDILKSERGSDVDKCFRVFTRWSNREKTYSDLHRDLGQYSIFRGRNPLDIAGVPMTSTAGTNPIVVIDILDEKRRAPLLHSPDIRLLVCLKPDRQTGREAVRVMEKVSPEWKKLALCLDFEEHMIRTIASNHPACEAACRDMFERWLQGRHNTRQPVTWETLITSLYEADSRFRNLADKLVAALCGNPTLESDRCSTAEAQPNDIQSHRPDPQEDVEDLTSF